VGTGENGLEELQTEQLQQRQMNIRQEDQERDEKRNAEKGESGNKRRKGLTIYSKSSGSGGNA